MRRARMPLIVVTVLLVALAVLFVAGPREPVDLTVRSEREAILADPVAYLAASEAEEPRIRPGLEKEIVWAFPRTRAKTPLAIVYVHGFSASKEEIRPVPDVVAEQLGANLYLARLTGHGADGAAMAEATVNDWVNDMNEALDVAEALGERTVVIGTSTGATLAALAASEPGLAERIDALVQISPNYKVRNRQAFVLDLPFAEWLAPTLGGAERSFETVNEQHAASWTSSYPTVATLPMAALVREVRGRTFETIDVPTLFVFDEGDTVVDHEATRRVAGRWGAATGARVNIELIEGTEDPYRHVIAGDALSPGTTERAISVIGGWIESLELTGAPTS